jgi:hypothetical protein
MIDKYITYIMNINKKKYRKYNILEFKKMRFTQKSNNEKLKPHTNGLSTRKIKFFNEIILD